MAFIEMQLGRYVDVNFLNTLKNNFQYFVDILTEKGYIHPLIPVELWDEVDYNYNIVKILPLFDLIEKSTTEIDGKTIWINDYSYYVEDNDYEDGEDWEENPVVWYEWSEKETNKQVLVKRWLDWMNYNYLILSGQEQMQQYLYVKSDDNISADNLYDASGEKIRTLEGYFE